jgi:hypothetical protein
LSQTASQFKHRTVQGRDNKTYEYADGHDRKILKPEKYFLQLTFSTRFDYLRLVVKRVLHVGCLLKRHQDAAKFFAH